MRIIRIRVGRSECDGPSRSTRLGGFLKIKIGINDFVVGCNRRILTGHNSRRGSRSHIKGNDVAAAVTAPIVRIEIQRSARIIPILRGTRR